MRVLLILLATAAGALSSATAPSSASTAPITLRDTAQIATYDLEVTTDDGTLTGELTVKRATAGLTADVRVGGNSPHVKSFVREGDGYVLTGGHDAFTIVYKLTFKRDSVSGTFAMSSGMKGTVAGAVRR